jgi:outer membrane lipoprotein-sorting protein
MHLGRSLVLLAFIVGSLLAPKAGRADDLSRVLQQLDVAAKDFHTTTANVEFDTIQTDPIPDKDVMTGMAYYERSGSRFQMAAHLTQHNNHLTGKTYILSGGTIRLSDTGKASDAKVVDQASKYASYFMLGFGASGAQLAEKWTMAYKGSETIDGVKTDELELIAKDPAVRKNIAKVTIWLDTSRAVSLKQVFDEGEGQSYICTYTNIKVNQGVPANAFAFDK